MFKRLYTGDDGQSHLEDLDLGAGGRSQLERPARRNGHHVPQHLARRCRSPGTSAPRKQYCITLSGQVEIGLGDGSKHYFGPGDVMLAEDLTGQGHTTRAVGPEPRVVAYVPVE